MKRALTIAAALAHRPPLIFLDEPTTGLDVMSARNLRGLIAGLRDEGVTVFLTTHYLEEAERLCDRVAIIVKGRIVALDTVAGLKAAAEGQTAVEVTTAGPDGRAAMQRIETDDVAAAVHAALARAGDRRVLAVNTVRPTLEDVFVRLTGLAAEAMLAEKGQKGGGNAAG
jgi:ABC-2 type transport system ATP-binding protein